MDNTILRCRSYIFISKCILRIVLQTNWKVFVAISHLSCLSLFFSISVTISFSGCHNFAICRCIVCSKQSRNAIIISRFPNICCLVVISETVVHDIGSTCFLISRVINASCIGIYNFLPSYPRSFFNTCSSSDGLVINVDCFIWNSLFWTID